MLQEIQPEKSCPKCQADMCITGTFRNRFFIHTCFQCETTFINKDAETKESVEELLDMGEKHLI